MVFTASAVSEPENILTCGRVTISEITARFYRAVFVTNSSDSSEKMRIIVKSKRAAGYAYDYKLSVIPTVVTT